MQVVKAPNKYILEPRQRTIFLAGSIEMGKAENWQAKLTKMLANENVLILNPRRDDWDSSWKQSMNNPPFRQQVEWELNAQRDADIIAMYFDPNTKSPITLLELGLFAHTEKVIVCCPEGFWRKGNVDIVCDNYRLWTAKDLDQLYDCVKYRIDSMNGGSCGGMPCCP